MRIGAVLGALALSSPSVHAQWTPTAAVETYLTEKKLDDLLALELEWRLAHEAGDEKQRVAERLAQLYATLLDQARDPARRKKIESRGRAMLADLPEGRALDLRLALAQDAFETAEDQAERRRLLLADQGEADSARRTFADLAVQLSNIAGIAGARLRSLERQEEALGRTDLLASALATSRRQRSMAHYLAGWSSAYLAELDPASAAAATSAALRHFGTLLNARPGSAPTLERVPGDMLAYDHVARSAIGTAMCYSIQGNPNRANEWLDLVQRTSTVPASVAGQVAARRMIVIARARDWRAMDGFVRRLTTRPPTPGRNPGPSGFTSTEARLLAVTALEAASSDTTGHALALAQRALAALATDGHTAQLPDLAGRYIAMISEDGAGGFLASYLRGVREYESARHAHEAAGGPPDAPTNDRTALHHFRSAARFLERAERAADAETYQRAVASAVLLRALSLFSSARSADDLLATVEVLSEASQRLRHSEPQRAGDAIRLAIRAVELASRRDAPRRTALNLRRAALVDEFIADFPNHSAASAFLYQRATSGTLGVGDAVAMLLRISETSELADVAYHEAARLLYGRFVDAARPSRDAAAQDFLRIAAGVLERDRSRLMAGDRTGVDQASLNARRVLECEFALDQHSADRINDAYDLLAALIGQGVVTDPAVLAEFQFRSVQLAMLRGDSARAHQAAAQLADLDPALSRQARRAIFIEATRQWEDAVSQLDLYALSNDEAARMIELARNVVDEGLTALHLQDPDAMDSIATDQPRSAAVVARASAFLWEQQADQRARDLASGLYRALLRAHPDAGDVLRASARFHESIDDLSAAADSYRHLLAGLSPPSDAWFEAKTRLLELLVKLDPARARHLLDQHAVLYPDLGPEPWRSRLRKVDRALSTDEKDGA